MELHDLKKLFSVPESEEGFFFEVSREIESYYYRVWPLLRRLAEVVPADAYAATPTFTGDGADEINHWILANGYVDQLYQLGFSARFSGGAWLWPYIEGDQSTAITPGQPYGIEALHVLTRHEVEPVAWQTSPSNQRWMRPKTIRATVTRDGAGTQTYLIDCSRLHYMPGLRAQPDENTGTQGYDLSVLEVYGPRISALQGALSGGATLISRLAMPMLRLMNSAAQAADKGSVRARLATFASGMQAGKLMILQGEDTLTWGGPNMSGFAQSTEVFERQISAVEGIPRTRLYGETVTGLSGQDGSGDKMYDDLLDRLRRLDYNPALQWLGTLYAGSSEGRREIEWKYKTRRSPEEEARHALLLAQRDVALLNTGAIDETHIERRLRENTDGYTWPESGD